jgi:hypothetical protein
MGRLDHAMKKAADKCLDDGNERFEKVLRTGSIVENDHNREEFNLAFTGKEFIHYPTAGFIDTERLAAMTEQELVDDLIRMMHDFDRHGYV